MAHMSALSYPKKSHRKVVRLPVESIELAEFFGIMIGDGGINNLWQANVTLNTVADAQYITHVVALIERLFYATPRVMARRTRKATVISLASTTVVDFLVRMGLPRGNKLKHGLKIPGWILRQKAYKIACVRGLVDTDGCLVLHIHKVSNKKYWNLYLSFSSKSPVLLTQVADILLETGLHPSFASNRREIYLYSAQCVKKYLSIVGTSNDRIKRVYTKWRGG